MEMSTVVITPVVETILAVLKKHLGYMIFCRKHVRDMHAKMTELDAIKLIVEEHKNRNTERRLEVPALVIEWLREVGTTNEIVENVGNGIGTCSPIYRYKLSVKALKIINDIEHVKGKGSRIEWLDDSIPLGRVDTMVASTSIPSNDHHNDFQSREHVFNEALRALGSDNKSHMIALCGMGGVGKTTIMKELKKVAEGRRMFHYITKVVIGENPNTIAIQQTVANYVGIELKESNKSERADALHIGFKAKADRGNINVLVILDDVWHSIDLEDIGLSPPIQGVHFKVLLTSRNKDVCTQMGVEANNVLNVGILKKAEAQSFFRQFLESCDDVDPDLNMIGEDIVSRCGGLPIAIKTMACTLRTKRKDVWKDALSRLENHGIHSVVHKVFKTSYDNLHDEETKSIFLMCGLFPEDFDIPTEELVRYGWGLKTFKDVYTLGEARSRLNTCIEQLMHTNLLLESDDASGYVKMHDLVLAFVLDMLSKVEHATIVNHGSMSGRPENDLSSFCKRISLTSKGMSKFPKDLYGQMEKLQVLSYDDNMSDYPLLTLSLQCSTNLRVLYIHKSSRLSDCSSIGNLLNLEVLSFANSSITWLPSTIGNLKQLRLLDLTNCVGISIDNGVLKKLVKLEELYMRFFPYLNGISFTNENCYEMAERSKNLYALEIEFFNNSIQPKNMSFEKLQRFKISLGSYVDGYGSERRDSSENMLELVGNKSELLESRINVLFEKTESLLLTVGDMNDLGDIELKPSHPP